MNKSKDRERLFRIILALPLAVILLTAPAFASYDYEKTETRELPGKDVNKLAVIASKCDVSVTGEKGADRIIVNIKRSVREDSEEKAKKLAEKMKVKVIEKEGLIELVTEYPGDGTENINIIEAIFGGGRKLRMHLDITVPERMDISFDTSSGDIEIFDIGGSVGVSSASGDVEADNLAGELVVKTASGDLEADRVGSLAVEAASGDITAVNIAQSCAIAVASGDVELEGVGGDLIVKAISGDIEVEGVKGNSQVSTTSGDIELFGIQGDLKAYTASGDLYVDAEPSEGDRKYELGTSGGSLALIFSRILEGGFILQASTTNGDFDLHLPIEISGMSRQKVSGVVREGRSRVFVETSSGDITIKEKGV